MNRTVKILLVASLIGNLAIVYVAYKALEYRSHINLYLDKYTEVVEEFSRRTEFADQDEDLQSDKIVPGRVVLFGTQLVSNWVAGDEPQKFEIVNRGIDGQRAAGLLLRFYQDVIRLRPEYVLIEISSYNLRPQWTIAEIEEYLRSMAELARFHQIKPILSTMVPLRSGADNYEGYMVTDSLKKYNQDIRVYAAENEFLLLDMFELVADQSGNLAEELSSGPIDLNEAGYLRISSRLAGLLAD